MRYTKTKSKAKTVLETLRPKAARSKVTVVPRRTANRMKLMTYARKCLSGCPWLIYKTAAMSEKKTDRMDVQWG